MPDSSVGQSETSPQRGFRAQHAWEPEGAYLLAKGAHDAEPEMAENQHYETVNPASVRIALVAALDQWEKSGCDCCSPTVADDALDGWGDVALWERMRRFGIELAHTAQNVIDMEGQD